MHMPHATALGRSPPDTLYGLCSQLSPTVQHVLANFTWLIVRLWVKITDDMIHSINVGAPSLVQTALQNCCTNQRRNNNFERQCYNVHHAACSQ